MSSAQGPKTHRERLVAFYEKYNPDKLPTVDATLEKFKGKEGELFAKLEAKYVKAEPIPPPSGSGPRCFLDISFNGESRALQFHSPKLTFSDVMVNLAQHSSNSATERLYLHHLHLKFH